VAEISASLVKALREKSGAGMMDCKRALADAGGDLAKAGDLLRERGLAKAGKREGRATSEGTVGIAVDGARAGIVELGCETDFVAKTDEFQKLAAELAGLAAAGYDSPDALLAAPLAGGTAQERVTAAIAQLGENVVLKRVRRLEVDGPGCAGGYVHAGGKLGVIVGLRTEAKGEAVDALAKDVAMHVAAHDPTPVSATRDDVPAEVVERERDILTRQAEQSGKPAGVIEKMVDGRLNKFFKEVVLLEQAFVKDPDQTVKQLLADATGRVGGEVAVAGFVRFRLGEAAAE